MKLLLTSNGLSNDSIAKAFNDLVGKKPQDTKVAFIPTAANVERGDKSWLIDDLYRIKNRGYIVDILEITSIKKPEIIKVLEESDVIFVGGGNTFYLSYIMQNRGLFDVLPELLETKVYAGISAGSMIAGKSLILASQAQNNLKAFKGGDYDLLGPKGQSSAKTLGLVDIVFRPHLNSRFFSMARADILKERAKDINHKIYALDDNSALKIVDNNISVISEGQWILLNNDKT